jgi:hypothetical protein
MMGSVTTAAERQARLAEARQDSRKRSQPEKQNQRDGKGAAHSARLSNKMMSSKKKLDNAQFAAGIIES